MYNSRHTLFSFFFAAASASLFARPVAAQGTLNLTSGDLVTVTAAGTISNRPGGTTTTSSYDAGSNFDAVDAEAGSVFNLAGGTVTGEDGDSAIFASGATVNISSGFVSVTGMGTDGVDALNSSTITVSGGTFTASAGNVTSGAATDAQASFPSPGPPVGSVDLYSAGSSTINVTGGLLSASGDGYAGLFAQSNGIINLFGTGFTVNGNPATGPITTGSGTISGTLLSGSVLTNLPYTVLGGTIQFTPAPAAAPEPSGWVVLLVGLAGMSGLIIYRRKSRVV